jgi:hypothetical protein
MFFFGTESDWAPVIDDVSAGVVHAAFVDPKVIVEETFAGVRCIGLSTTTRHPAVPDIPTIAESGLASYDANSWVSVVAPARTPTAIAEQLLAAFRHIVASAEFKQYLATQTDLAQSVAQRGSSGPRQRSRKDVQSSRCSPTRSRIAKFWHVLRPFAYVERRSPEPDECLLPRRAHPPARRASRCPLL